jgi:hypothetical protein
MKRYGIIGIFGDRERGKTTFMVKHMINELNNGINYDIGYANIRIDHPKIKFINYEGIKNLRLPTQNGTPRAILGIDQIHKYLDSRMSLSKRNVDFSNVMIESRQHGFDPIYTTWMRSAVDKRLRPFTQLFILAQRDSKGFLYDFVDKDGEDLGPPRRMTWEIAREVWKTFDSTELIEDPTIPA